MSRERYHLRRARRQYRCTECERRMIEVGDRYLYGACPPEADINNSGGWWVFRACLRCADKHHLHTPETRAKLEVAK